LARMSGSVCRLCRREGEKLFLKTERCYTDKCAIERRKYPPGQHGQGRRKVTDYGLQLREKQKAKRTYGLLEKQFRIYFSKADRKKGVTGENLLQLLESRLDNVVFRMGFAGSRPQSRQLVRHNHVKVNGRKVNIPSFQVRAGDEISIREKSRKIPYVNEAMETMVRRGVPPWIELNKESFSGVFRSVPTREEIGGTINEQLIVELYSK
jgi:small subunit ribosomal protein S4